MLFAETSGTNKSYLHSLFFVFAVDEAFLVNLYDYPVKQGMQLLYLVHTKDNKPKDQIVKSASNTQRLAIET